ncbi:Aldose 1-epimerase [termite gut metagenome]|jgi:aldose 1-epimerase|uniref:aldose 1-epimerase n=1 Tax=termite gut metagenome TaxID=433724 RepID=A0A5J4PVH9_9ZZZZ
MNNILIKSVLYHKENTIDLIRITNDSDAYVEIMNYGAIIISIVVPNRNGKLENVALRYEDYNNYLSNPHLLGATVGRVANRISHASFTLNGIVYNLDKNDGNNSIHGGFNGFHKKIYNYYVENGKLILYTMSKEGEGGFPGNMKFSVSYSFSNNNELFIEYKASADKTTPINFTNHSYFNLSGKNPRILEDELQVNAEMYIESNREFLPTGRILPVEGTAFDFRTYAQIADKLKLKKDNLKGYNAYFVKRENHKARNPLASFRNVASGRVMDIYTSMPGILIYTGDFLSKTFMPFEGICFEAQYHPDGVNHPEFNPNILSPGEIKTDNIKYHFYLCKHT